MVNCGDCAERNAERCAEEQRGNGEFQGSRQALPDVDRYGPARVGALTEVETGHLPYIDDELLVKRPVETVLMANFRDLLRRCVFTCKRGGRIGRHDADQE